MKVMIVEDDVMYRYALRTIINWENYGYTIASEAINGVHALELMKNVLPDIIITDISMPQMNGIDLIKKVKSDFPLIKFIVLSNYEDFTFVKEAMKYGAEEYFLKAELNAEDLFNLLEKTKGKIIEEKENEKHNSQLIDSIKDNFFIKLFRGELADFTEILRNLNLLKIKISPSNMIIAYIDLAPIINKKNQLDNFKYDISQLRKLIEKLLEKFSGIVIGLDNNDLVVLFSFAEEKSECKMHNTVSTAAELLQGELNNLLKVKISIGISNLCNRIENIKEAYSQSKLCIDETFYRDKGNIIRYSQINFNLNEQYQKYDILKIVAGSLKQENDNWIEKEFNDYFEILSKMHLRVNKVKPLLLEMLTGLFIICKDNNIDPLNLSADLKPVELMDCFTTLMEFKQFSINMVSDLYADLRSSKVINNKEINKAISYIKENYAKEISLSSMAKELNFSPNYLSSLFKQETSYRFIEFVNRVRVEEAKKYLRNTNMKVYEVAQKVGFSNMPYFCTVFKEITGLTISEFKNKNGS